MIVALMYHDVVNEGHEDASGFLGPGALRYKITPDCFQEHLAAIAQSVSSTPGLAPDLTDADAWLMTFDDGGATAFRPIADLLEERGWRGHFFITTDRIGTPGFVTAWQIQELRKRGHQIG